MSSAGSPAVPAFSYAQAAQGLTRNSQSQLKSPGSNSITSETNTKETRSAVTEPAKLDLNATQQSTKSSRDASSSRLGSGSDSLSGSRVDAGTPSTHIEEPKPSVNPGDTPSVPVSISSFQSTPENDPEEQHEVGSHTRETTDVSDNPILTPAGSDKLSVLSEKKKSRDEDGDWEHLSSPLIPAEKDLKPAPIPVVNFWTQRKAEQAAKTRVQANQRTSGAVTTAKGGQPTSNVADVSKRKPTEKASGSRDREATGGQKKDEETARAIENGRQETSLSSAPPSSQQKNLSDSDVLPPVQDPASWPTPETATTDDRRKSASLEKPDSRITESKSNRPKWDTMPFVPTVVFNTPIPSSARRGGRGGGRGRDGPPRGTGSHTAGSSEKSEPVGSMGPPPVPKSHEQERGRKTDSTKGGRATSLPTHNRRNESGSGRSGEYRKPSETSTKDNTRQSQLKSSNTEVTASPISIGTIESANNSGLDAYTSVSRLTNNVAEASRPNPTDTPLPVSSTEESHAHPLAEAMWSSSQASEIDWPRGGNHGTRAVGDGPKDKPFAKSREYREKSDYSRDSWRERDRDRDASWETSSRRDSRSDRGRGGYRGRGSRDNYGSQGTSGHSFTAPLPQQAFPNAKTNSYGDSRNRQSSQPYPGLQTGPGSRTNPRSQSIPTPNAYVQYSMAIPGMMSPVSPIQTDPMMYAYGQFPGMMPPAYNNTPLNQFGLYSMVISQLDFYFSVDNLCKDMFLRKNMDSQGWVSLDVIASFPRMKQLIQDETALKYACSVSNTVDYLPGENGQPDRVRRRHEYSKFVIPMAERFIDARHDGPQVESGEPPSATSNGYPQWSGSSPNQMTDSRIPQWSATAFEESTILPATEQNPPSSLDGLPLEVMRSTDNMIMSPTGHPVPLTFGSFGQVDDFEPERHVNGSGPATNVNGTHFGTKVFRDDSNDTFPDQQIADLKIVVRKPDPSSPTPQPPFMSLADRTFSHGSIDDVSQLMGQPHERVALQASGLRGGSGSPQQLEKLQYSRASSTDPIIPLEPPPVLWTKNGSAQMVTEQEDVSHEPYLIVRERALEQREQDLPSDDTNVLYEFWSHFLVRNFNLGMYQEFRILALDDLQNGSDAGSKHLALYYQAVLSGKTCISDRIAHDVVEMAMTEGDGTRHVFRTLRTAWRNGAFNLKSRKKITDILSLALRAELDR